MFSLLDFTEFWFYVYDNGFCADSEWNTQTLGLVRKLLDQVFTWLKLKMPRVDSTNLYFSQSFGAFDE